MLRELLDRCLQAGTHPETGLFYHSANLGQPNPGAGKANDCWGYVLFSYANYDLAMGEDRYRTAIEKPMRWLAQNHPDFHQVKDTLWPDADSSDCWSDSYESMVILWKRYPISGGFEWLDWATRQHIHRRHGKTRQYGPFTGGHFDGSTGRTLCAHMMVCSQGVRTVPFVEGLRLGSVQDDGELFLTMESDKRWEGKLCFDCPRDEQRGATADWARVNEAPLWFVARPEREYRVTVDGAKPIEVTGKRLIEGLNMAVRPREVRKIRVRIVK